MRSHLHFYLIVFAILISIIGVNLFAEGMFADGLIYADVSKNLINKPLFSWDLTLTKTLYPEFYEHPPLVFWLQGGLFKLFGDSIYIERAYSLLMFFTSAFLIVKIWKQLTNTIKYGWVPLLLWGTIGNVTWSFANNMLENTLTVFVLLAFWLIFKSQVKRRFLYLTLAGVFLFLGFMTKGFVVLYIWGVPFFYWLFIKRVKFINILIDNVLIIIFTVLPFVFIYHFNTEAQSFFDHYFEKQLIGSLENVETVSTRFAIVWMFLQQITGTIILILIFLFIVRKKVGLKELVRQNSNYAYFTLAIVFSGILPIMISMKQRSFYILSVYPILMIGLSYWLFPVFNVIEEKIKAEPVKKWGRIVSGVLLVISVLIIGVRVGTLGRDIEVIEDCKIITQEIGEGKTINICSDMFDDWSMHAYFMRYGNISLEQREEIKCQYLLMSNSCNVQPSNNWRLVPVDTKKYKLYERVK